MKQSALFLSLLVTILALFVVALPVEAAQSEVQEVRIWVTPGHLRVVLDTRGRPVSRLFPMSDPERLVLDMQNTRLAAPLPRLAADHPALASIRTGTHGRSLRVVLDLKQRVKAKTFSLPGNQDHGPQVVVDLDVHGLDPVSQPQSHLAVSPSPSPPPLQTIPPPAAGNLPQPRVQVIRTSAPRAPSLRQGASVLPLDAGSGVPVPPPAPSPSALSPNTATPPAVGKKAPSPATAQPKSRSDRQVSPPKMTVDASPSVPAPTLTERRRPTDSANSSPEGKGGSRSAPPPSMPRSNRQGKAQVANLSGPVERPSLPRELIIAIDAGHGGEDPGATGPSGVREKDVVMAIARQLARQVGAQPGMRAVMIRNGDDYLALRQRIQKAREAGADLFVSIHADAFNDPEVSGASVYTLSQRGASSEAARLLAEKENSVDLVRGVALDTKDEVLASVILDMSLSGTMEASQQAARHVLRSLKRVGKSHRASVQHAAFAVLKAPDIPSMLVETAFISNPREEARLREPEYQRRLARAVLSGIKEYFSANPPPETRLAQAQTQRRHTIGRGESLSTIAERYRVNLRELRGTNNLASDQVRVGQVLAIPES